MAIQNDPIAIIGLAFRFPGDLSDEHAFWQALKDGRDLVGTVGEDRWAVEELKHPARSEPGRSITFSAGVLSRVEEFDAAFFGISPREAAWLDPQQRLLLELAWEALENGGQVPSRLAGSDIAVYVGMSGFDYGLGALDDLASMTAHSMTGNTLSVAANRLSYVFDLHGPSLAVDTACSSSLVALHHACNSLRSGEARAALVGGVSLLMHPYPFVGFTKASMLSANGRCRAFDAAGDGYVRAEGGAVLYLKPLSRALADGDDIQALILGTGVNADGSRKTGLTIPSSDAQAELMQSVLARAGVPPQEVDYIEAHGTGTPVGDPVEAAAIGKVFGWSRPGHRPLPIGSVKTNLGHLEPASGMAGLVKTVLALRHRALPPSLHFENPNPDIDFTGLNLEVVTDFRPLEAPEGRPLRAGVNSFGFGGANAHALLQEYCPQPEVARKSALSAPPLFLSARTAQALRETAARYAELLAPESQMRKAGADFYDIAHAAAHRRQRFEKRLALQAADAGQAAEWLGQFAQHGHAAQVAVEDALLQPGGVAFIYSGNGAQWVGMGRRLLAQSSTFAEVVTRLDAMIRPLAGFSILKELNTEGMDARLGDTAVAQPLLFAVQVALTELLREQGVEAQAVAGHSVGEVAAAWAAGALELDQAVAVICARSLAQARTQGNGRMAAVGLGEAAMRELLSSGRYGEADIAGINSPDNVTLSGNIQELEQLRQALEPRGVFFRLLDLDYAFHSRQMDPLEDGLLNSLAHLAPQSGGHAAYVSSVTGAVAEGAALDGHYWWRNVRQPVRFAQAVSTLIAQGCRIFVEIGPHAILQRYVHECLQAEGVEGRVLATLRRNDDGLARVEEAALRVHLLNDASRLAAYFPQPSRAVRLPNYPWQREHYSRPRTNEAYALAERRRVHPLLGWRLREMDAAWENTLDPATLPWLADHQVGGAVVLPGAAYVEMALAAAHECFGGERFELEELDILAPVVFDAGHARTLRFELSPRDGSFQIRSRQRLSEDGWTLNAAGRLPGAPSVTPDVSPADITAVNAEAAHAVSKETHYQLTAAIGLDYGPAFRGLGVAHVQGDALHATLVPPEGVSGDAARGYFLHPALLDVCFQSLADFFRHEIASGHGVPLLPVKVGRLRFHARTPVVRFRAHLARRGARSVTADFDLLDAAGRVVAILSGCRFRAAMLQRQGEATPACWNITPQLSPHPADQAEAAFPPNHELSRLAGAWFSDEEPRLNRVAYFKEALPLFEALTVSLAYEAFRQLFASRGGWLQQALSTPASGQADGLPWPFFRWLAGCLRDEGLLIEQDGIWRLQASSLPPPDEIWRTLLRDFPACLPELALAARVGLNLPVLLTGDVAGAPFLEGMKTSHSSETLYDDAPAYLGSRLAIEQILRNLAAGVPGNRRLRILEIGGGADDMPRHLAGMLPGERLDYVLAVSDEALCSRLQTEFQNHPFVIVANFSGDELELASENALPECFDVVILRHWLHRARHPIAALVAAQRKLSRGGVLLLAERHPDLGANFVNGLDPHWWHEMEGAAPASWLLSPSAWETVLKEQNFRDIEVFLEPASDGLAEGSYLLLASRPHESATEAEPAISSWLLLADADGDTRRLAGQLMQRLESRGQHVAVAFAERDENAGWPVYVPHDPDSLRTLISAVHDRLGVLGHVVHLAGEGCAAGGKEFPEGDACVGLLHLVQALAGQEAVPPRLWLVTSGGALASDIPDCCRIDPAQASLWGLGRVVMNEYPALECTLIDIACEPDSPDLPQRLENELLLPDGESEIILSRHARYGLRMRRSDTPDPLPAGMEAAPRFRLDFHAPGQLRNLVWMPDRERHLSDDEVEVRTVVTGLNFRDVMYTMGLLPDEAVENGFAGASLGLEFSGVITRTGERVREFAPGDQVIGFAPACFSSHVVTKANALVLKPAEWSFEEAATVPTVFFTVYYALKHLASLQPGERILIHGAAGGVGIAAVQLASQMGAEIFATAGSGERRDFVRLLGADHVFDSRSLDFAEQVLAHTGGQGVDVVLNSLAGEAIRRNLRVLRPFGRFLELGKRDFFENTPIGLRPFKDNISYFGIDADQLLIARPDLAARLFREVMSLFREGTLSPLPYRAFPAERVVDAFRAMQQSRHIGKVVVKLENARVGAGLETPVSAVRFNKDATYLVTGGLSGFGLESARWLAAHGAGNLVLLGRRGMQTPDAAELVSEFDAQGIRVRVAACDVADRAALQAVIDGIRRDMPPLKGILHAAMALDDALIANLDAGRFRAALRPKLLGAKYLHELTLDIPIDHFILYSSVTTFIGNPGQAGYVAANAYLEGLANLRRSMGLPADCIGWGPIGDAGYLTRNAAVKASLQARLGAAPLTAKRALDTLEGRMPVAGGNLAIADFAWHTMARLLASAGSARFERIRREAGKAAGEGAGMDFASLILGRPTEAVLEIVQGLVIQEVAKILGTGADRIDPLRPLNDLGMDSLMGVELALGLEGRFGIRLPAMLLNEGPTAARVAQRITEKIMNGQAEEELDDGGNLRASINALAGKHGETLSDEEVSQAATELRAHLKQARG